MKKGPASDSDTFSFKKPSLLGLDKLAAAKRPANNDVDTGRKKSKISNFKDEDDFGSSSDSSSSDEDDRERDKKDKDRRKER